MSAQDDCAEWFARIQARDPRAWRELFDAVRGDLRLLRRRLSRHLQAYFDGEDALLGGCCAFLEHLEQFRFTSRERVRAYLGGAARRQLQRAHRHSLDGKHLSDRQRQPLDRVAGRGLAAPGPGPEETVQKQDFWECVVRDRPQEKRVLEMLREGYSRKEIALACHWSVRQVGRAIDSIRQSASALSVM